jgi:hypothetical protein
LLESPRLEERWWSPVKTVSGANPAGSSALPRSRAAAPSKVAAAEWALRRDPTLGVVGDALRRHGDPAARVDSAQVQQLLGLVRAWLAETRESPEGARIKG